MFIPSGARNLLFLHTPPSPLTPRLPQAKPRGHFLKTHRHTLPCLRRAPNSLGTNWPVFKHPFHPFPPVVILSVAKDLIPPRHPNLLHRQPRPLRPLPLSESEGSTHASQTGTPPGSTGATRATSAQTANSFRINT